MNGDICMRKFFGILICFLFLIGCSNDVNGVEKKVYKKAEEYIQVMNDAHNGDDARFKDLESEIFDFIEENTDHEDEETGKFIAHLLILYLSVEEGIDGKERDSEAVEDELKIFKDEYGINVD